MIKTVNLCKDFGKLKVLRDINVHISQGEVIAVIGPSGSGKSTFLRCLNRLEEPTSGSIFIDGVDIMARNTNINQIRAKLGMVFQNFNLFPHKTVLDNIMLAPIKVKNISKENAQNKAMELLKRVGLQDKKNAYPNQLSGGQKQRIAIARALAMEPEIMLFDEPTSALDPEMIKEVLDVMIDLARDGMTMMIVTHEMGFAKNVASRVLFMNEGTVLEDKPPHELFENPTHSRTKEFLYKVLSR